MDENSKEEQSISINDMEYLPVTKSVKESMRVQKTEYIRQQMRKRQENEDALMVQLLEEQRVIDGLQKKINENLDQTKASSQYNKEFKESMNAQIYALHGISEDKLEGMREYKNAYYQGSAFSLFLLLRHSSSYAVRCTDFNRKSVYLRWHIPESKAHCLHRNINAAKPQAFCASCYIC